MGVRTPGSKRTAPNKVLQRTPHSGDQDRGDLETKNQSDSFPDLEGVVAEHQAVGPPLVQLCGVRKHDGEDSL